MFFSKSSDTENHLKTAASVVSTLFDVPPEQAKRWTKTEGKSLNISLPFAAGSQHGTLLDALKEAGVDTKTINVTTDIEAKQTKMSRLNRVKNIIAVGSGKGGVGKSATSVNLAYALAVEGAKVGILDADIYGPSVPIMLGNPEAHPESEDQKHMFPLEVEGVYANSIGYLVPPENAAIWRGPMASRALNQLVNETLWPELDYLIIDMPPGTGDIQLTLAQQVPVTAAVVVTTPQDLALADAVKGIAMFNKVDVPVLGLIENMSYYQCSNCGHKEHVFSSGGGESLAHKYDVALLGQLPLDIRIREHADGGKPLLRADPDSPLSLAYRAAARQLSQTLALHTQISNDLGIPVTEKD